MEAALRLVHTMDQNSFIYLGRAKPDLVNVHAAIFAFRLRCFNVF